MEIIEIIRKMDQGQTEPWLCRAENDRLYVVKGKSAGAIGCVREYIGGCLGKAFGLPIPDFEILSIPEPLLEIEDQYRIKLGEDPVFGSVYEEHLEELNRTILRSLDAQVLKDLFVFDYWIRNGDRMFTDKGGNPNVFYRSSDGKVVVVDHNLAFDDDFELEEFKQYHLGRDAWFGQGLAELGVNYYTEKMQGVMENFDTYCDNLPLQWMESSTVGEGWPAKAGSQLIEFKEKIFWEKLK